MTIGPLPTKVLVLMEMAKSLVVSVFTWMKKGDMQAGKFSDTFQILFRYFSETFQILFRDFSETFQRLFRDFSETFQRLFRISIIPLPMYWYNNFPSRILS
jgi:hypothetical protein